MLARSLLATAVLVASAAAAAAATITPVRGAISVNSGAGFQSIGGAVEVRPGDRILVGEGGRAQIRFSLTCAAALAAGVHVVPTAPRCETGATDPQTTGAIDSPTGNIDSRLILGGLVAAGTTAAIVAAAQSDDKPASP